MTEDFQLIKEAVTIGEVVTALGLQKGKSNYYFPGEKCPSLMIDNEKNSFYDFGRGGVYGDCIKLWAHVRGCDTQWQAVKEMREYFGISEPNKASKAEIREKIRQQQAKEQARKEAKQTEKQAWVERVEFIQSLLVRIDTALSSQFDPFGDWRMELYDEKAKINHELDCLAGVGG